MEAADLPAAERAAFLDRVCADAAVRQEVDALLQADVDSGAAVADAVESAAAHLLGNTSLAGARLGAYRLHSEIGHGGMGSVYLAERDDDAYRKVVAIKVIRFGMDTDDVLRRFRHERQILASLDHPYIARLLDGGTTPDGRPYFVMEHVEGEPIDVYCRAHRLDIQSRLRLFVQVCEAVSYSHRALVVHRDLKPGNILVTSGGVPKLLDFGVAKLLGPDADSGLTRTALSNGPLTPEYASPEQVRGLPITTAADVYALGAILFELLTGVRAQPVETCTPSEVERVVCGTEVARPSAVRGAAVAPGSIDGDLDNIVLMAMRKEPERRYRSVDQLADDIRRHLNGLPIVARQDSFGYRARKFAGRHRLPLAAAAVVVLSLVIGATVAIAQARAAQAARRTAEQRLTAMVELADRSLYDVHSAIEKLPGATEARRQIVTTTLKYLEDLSKDLGRDDRLQFVLSVSYSKVAGVLGRPMAPNLGDSAGALANYRRSIQLIEPLLAKEPDRSEYIRQYVDAQKDLAAVLAAMGDTTRAVAALRGALPAAQKLERLCPHDKDCTLAEGAVYSALVEAQQAIDSRAALDDARHETESYERSLKTLPDDPDVQLELATAYSQEAKILNTRGDLAQAADRYQRAITLKEGIVQRNPADVLLRRSLMITYGNLGGNLGSPFYQNLGDVTGARQYYGKALAIARDLANADTKNQLAQYDVANALMFSATLDVPKQEWPASLSQLREADGILQRVIAADPQSTSKLRPLAMVEEYEGRRLEGLGHRDEAAAQYRRSITSARRGLDKNPSDLSFLRQTLASERALAELLARMGDHAAALDTIQGAIARVEHVSAPESDRDRVALYAAGAYASLGEIQAAAGKWGEARSAAERAVAGYHALAASNSLQVSHTQVARAEALLRDCLMHP